MRTPEEIVEWYRERRDGQEDFFGVIGQDVLIYVPFETVREFLKPETTEAGWEAEPLTDEGVIGRMRDYMEFAWDKALGERGISSSRSIDHFRAWLFLLGDDELLAFAGDEGNYPQYGKPILVRICEKYGFPMPTPVELAR